MDPEWFFSPDANKIAKKEGVTPEEVLREMQIAIDSAFDHHDANAQPLWDSIEFKGSRPTPEEFVMQIAKILKL